MLCPSDGYTLEESDMVPQINLPVIGSFLTNPIEDEPPLSSERHDLASPAQVVEPSCLAPWQESLQLPLRDTNTRVTKQIFNVILFSWLARQSARMTLSLS